MHDPSASVATVAVIYLALGLWGLAVLGFLYLVYLGATGKLNEELPDVAGEYDALLAEHDEAAKAEVRRRHHDERARAAQRMAARLGLGCPHDGQEL